MSDENDEICIVCGDKEPCSHDFEKMHEQLEEIGRKMGTEQP